MPALITEYAFEELQIIPGLYANGHAEIHIFDGGEWFIKRIFLNGENNKPEKVDPRCVGDRETLERKIFLHICSELEFGKRASKVEAQVQEAIEGEVINRQAAE